MLTHGNWGCYLITTDNFNYFTASLTWFLPCLLVLKYSQVLPNHACLRSCMSVAQPNANSMHADARLILIHVKPACTPNLWAILSSLRTTHGIAPCNTPSCLVCMLAMHPHVLECLVYNQLPKIFRFHCVHITGHCPDPVLLFAYSALVKSTCVNVDTWLNPHPPDVMSLRPCGCKSCYHTTPLTSCYCYQGFTEKTLGRRGIEVGWQR